MSKGIIGAWLLAAVCGPVVGTTRAEAQTAPIPARMVSVDGKAMRVWSAGIEQRKAGQPVVILEAGAGEPGTFPLDTWKPVFPEIARMAPVVAYERRGNGMSEADTEPPTLRRVARVLHALLQETRVAPPYVLVGHSWGGNYIRAFFDLYPNEVVGLVFIDADTGMGPTREEKAAVVPPENRAETLAPPVLPPIPPNTPTGLRAEFEQIGKEMVSDGAETRTLRPVSGIPVAVIVATPPARMRGISGAITRLMIQHDLELVLPSPNGILVTANVGHAVHEHDPVLVAHAIQHVLDHPPTGQAR
jgi:pimeloyl-ACP methyl ester carboxylesterase